MQHWQPIYREKKKRNNRSQKSEVRSQKNLFSVFCPLSSGFTLIELLIVMTIFSIVSIAVYATFASGMGVWQRAGEVSIAERKDILRIEKLSHELRQTFDFKDIGFSGSKDKINFAAIVDGDIVRLTYFLDAGKKIIFQSTDKLVDILAAKQQNETLESKPKEFLSNVDKLSFSFFYFDLQKNAYAWKEDWQQSNPPLAVKLDITVNNSNHAEIIFIPSA